MKKVLLFSLSLVLGFSAFAQQRVSKGELNSAKASANKTVVGKEVSTPSAAQFAPQTAKSVVVNRYQDMEYAQTMWTNYDLQSNQYCANRMYQLPDGSVAAVATMSHEANQVASDRGTGYNFYKDGAWMDEPETRVESFKTGWPTIAQWGETGEILLCHGGGHLSASPEKWLAKANGWIWVISRITRKAILTKNTLPGREWSPLATTTTSSMLLLACNTPLAATKAMSKPSFSAQKTPPTGK